LIWTLAKNEIENFEEKSKVNIIIGVAKVGRYIILHQVFCFTKLDYFCKTNLIGQNTKKPKYNSNSKYNLFSISLKQVCVFVLFTQKCTRQSKLRQSAALHESAQQEQFNEVAYEKERLEKDAEAMDAMKIVAENEFAKLRTPWKREINLGHDGRAQHCPISKTSTSSHY